MAAPFYNNSRFLAGMARRPPRLVPVTPVAGEAPVSGELPPSVPRTTRARPETTRSGDR